MYGEDVHVPDISHFIFLTVRLQVPGDGFGVG